METSTLIYILAAILGVFAIWVWSRKGKTVANVNKTGLGVAFLIVAAFLILMQMGYLVDYGVSPLLSASSNVGTPGVTTTSSGQVITTYQPTATFAAKDMFASTAITGTSYYKRGSNPASTTSISNTNPGETISYWVDNQTYWVTPVTQQAGAGVTAFQALGYANGTATITGYDLVGRASTANGASNISMAANKQANLEITYQGTSKASAMPFGGLMVVEANSSIASITCSGDDIASSNPFHLTYTVTATSNAFRVFPIASSIDDGSGDVRKIVCQFNNGGSAAGDGVAYYIKFIPANYYVSNDGEIILDTEKFADDAVTRTGSTINFPSMTSYWGA